MKKIEQTINQRRNEKACCKEEITRREALKKTGKYIAATAAATFIILNPKQSQATSPAPPGWGAAPKQKVENIANNESEMKA